MVVTVVTVTVYCYGRRAHTYPRRKGSFLAIFLYGGRQRGIALPSDQKTRFAGFAVRTGRQEPAGRMPRQCWRVWDWTEYERCEPKCVPSSQVCTPNTKTAREENSMLVGVCRGSTPANHEIGHRDMGRKGLQNLDPLGRRSDHPIHPLASVIVRQHHVQAELLAQHPGNRPAHGVRLPASGQHQLQAGRPLRTA